MRPSPRTPLLLTLLLSTSPLHASDWYTEAWDAAPPAEETPCPQPREEELAYHHPEEEEESGITPVPFPLEITAAVILLGVCLGGCVYYFLTKKSTTQEQEPNGDEVNNGNRNAGDNSKAQKQENKNRPDSSSKHDQQQGSSSVNRNQITEEDEDEEEMKDNSLNDNQLPPSDITITTSQEHHAGSGRAGTGMGKGNQNPSQAQMNAALNMPIGGYEEETEEEDEEEEDYENNSNEEEEGESEATKEAIACAIKQNYAANQELTEEQQAVLAQVKILTNGIDNNIIDNAYKIISSNFTSSKKNDELPGLAKLMPRILPYLHDSKVNKYAKGKLVHYVQEFYKEDVRGKEKRGSLIFTSCIFPDLKATETTTPFAYLATHQPELLTKIAFEQVYGKYVYTYWEWESFKAELIKAKYRIFVPELYDSKSTTYTQAKAQQFWNTLIARHREDIAAILLGFMKEAAIPEEKYPSKATCFYVTLLTRSNNFFQEITTNEDNKKIIDLLPGVSNQLFEQLNGTKKNPLLLQWLPHADFKFLAAVVVAELGSKQEYVITKEFPLRNEKKKGIVSWVQGILTPGDDIYGIQSWGVFLGHVVQAIPEKTRKDCFASLPLFTHAPEKEEPLRAYLLPQLAGYPETLLNFLYICKEVGINIPSEMLEKTTYKKESINERMETFLETKFVGGGAERNGLKAIFDNLQKLELTVDHQPASFGKYVGFAPIE